MALKIMILGANGMAGHMIHDYIMSIKKPYTIVPITRKECDIRNWKQFKSIYDDLNPTIVINCIGILNKEANQEKNIETTIEINSLLPHKLSELPAKIIHLSTDCVFSGNHGPYYTYSPTDATDTYGKTKALGELNNTKDLTLRTSIIGPELKEGIGLFHWFITNKDAEIFGFKNVIWSGVTTLELAKAIQYCIENNTTGLKHLSNNIFISKYELLHLFKKYFNKKITINKSHLEFNHKGLIPSYFGYMVPSYEKMMIDLKKQIMNNDR